MTVTKAIICGLCSLLVIGQGSAHAQRTGAVITKAGVSVKLITTRDTSIFRLPDQGSDSSPCSTFRYWYVLPPEDNGTRDIEEVGSLTRNGFYKISASEAGSDFKGWIHEDDAVEWHHRQALRFATRQGRDRAHFYLGQEEAQEAVKSGNTTKATHREPENTGNQLILMPLLSSREFDADGENMEVYELAFMSGHPGGEAQPQSRAGLTVSGIEGEITTQIIRAKATADIVFAIDTTASMENAIAQVQRSIESVSEQLRSNPGLRPRLRFGLVGYRDTVPDMTGMEYLTRVFCTLEAGADHGIFLKKLKTLQVAKIGSGDYPEDVLAGLATALNFDDLKWNPVGWKQIIVVGDASMKGPDHPGTDHQMNNQGRSIAQIMTIAQPAAGSVEELVKSGFVISAVSVLDPEAEYDHPVSRKQFTELVAGRQFQGRHLETSTGEDFSAELASIIMERLQNLESCVTSQSSSPGGSPQVMTKPGPAAPQADPDMFPWPVLELIAAVSGTSGGPDFQFASRFSTEFDAAGNRQLVPALFVRRGSLLSFNAMLDVLQGQMEDAGEPGSKDVALVVKNLQTVSAALNLEEPIDANLPLDRFLRLLLGFPVKNPIFNVTLADLAAMSQTDYNDWMKSIKAQQQTIKTLTENTHIWRKLHSDARDRDAHAFVALVDLP